MNSDRRGGKGHVCYNEAVRQRRDYKEKPKEAKPLTRKGHVLQTVCHTEAGHENQQIRRQESPLREFGAIHLSYRSRNTNHRYGCTCRTIAPHYVWNAGQASGAVQKRYTGPNRSPRQAGTQETTSNKCVTTKWSSVDQVHHGSCNSQGIILLPASKIALQQTIKTLTLDIAKCLGEVREENGEWT